MCQFLHLQVEGIQRNHKGEWGGVLSSTLRVMPNSCANAAHSCWIAAWPVTLFRGSYCSISGKRTHNRASSLKCLANCALLGARARSSRPATSMLGMTLGQGCGSYLPRHHHNVNYRLSPNEAPQ
eukprot:2956026-Amphidinium_carterae.1